MDPITVRAQHQISRDIMAVDGHPLIINDMSFVTRGKVFTIYRGALDDGRQVGVRIVPEHWLASERKDDPAAIPPRDIVLQETLLTTHCASHDIPTPRIIGPLPARR